MRSVALQNTDKRLALQAYEEILQLIESGDARSGDIVTERRLAERLSMSRTPVRDALLMLEGEGLLIRHGSRGLQVKQMRVEEYMDVLQVRLLLEPPVARMAAGKVPQERIVDLKAMIESVLQGGETRAERDTVRRVDEQLHSALTDAVGNPQLSQIIQNLRRQTQMFDLRSMPERFANTCSEHLHILEAIESGDGAEAERRMAEHLTCVQDSIIRRLTRR